jgi:single-strand DNA-binding protein
MYSDAQFSVAGNVATDPEYKVVGAGIPRLTMRVCWTTRRKDGESDEWVDGNTSFINVTCWRRLAMNLRTCLRKGDPVLLRGRLDVRQYTTKDGHRGQSVDVAASHLSHDLNRGTSDFRRIVDSAGKTAEEAEALRAAAGEAGLGGSADDDGAALGAGLGAGADGDDMFDDSAIDALAQETDSASAPF